EAIYEDDADRVAFLEVLAEGVERFNWLVHAYCLMGNHYHLLVETPDGNLSQGMRHLNGVYTQFNNRQHRRVGHLFQGRYKSVLIQKEAYLLEVSRYVALNPVRARMIRHAEDWPWSHYRAVVGLAVPPPWLTTDWILSAFAPDRVGASSAYRRFVEAGRNQPAPWARLRNQVFLGDDAFVDDMRAHVQQLEGALSEVPRAQRAGRARPLAAYAAEAENRDAAIAAAYASGGYSMREVGEYFGLHYSRVSRILNRSRRNEAKGKT
ncbi:MAG TPA: transposase, partial [Nevskiaceae bacterium]|nr:transposase [Nevskiaceae bacterium]